MYSLFKTRAEGSTMRQECAVPKRTCTTPLKNFVEVKAKTLQAFQEIGKMLDEMSTLLNSIQDNQVAWKADIEQIQNDLEAVKMIQDVLTRDQMKVVFFGRTSNGKSTVINAMLGQRVLPSSIGHTTTRFIQVEGSLDGEKFVAVDNDLKNRLDISHLKYAEANDSVDSPEDTLYRLFWPKTESKFFENDVAFVDSPGIDFSLKLDKCIENYCMDADVFVFVANSESTFSLAEKKFFLRVREKFSRPNVFVLNNRWDASDHEPEFADRAQEQHMTQFVTFLVDKLEVDEDEAKRRIFFVSAIEVLQRRMKSGKFDSMSGDRVDKSCEERFQEFERFEAQFETCISRTAIETKFKGRIEQGRKIMVRLNTLYKNVINVLITKRNELMDKSNVAYSDLESKKKEYSEFLENANELTNQLNLKVRSQVTAHCKSEIDQLVNIINSFKGAFVDTKENVEFYKQNIAVYVDQELNQKLRQQCTGNLLQQIMTTEKNLADSVVNFVSTSSTERIQDLLNYKEAFQFSFDIQSESWMKNFNEDLNFYYSLGLPSFYRRAVEFKKRTSIVDLNKRMIDSRDVCDIVTKLTNVSVFGLMCCGLYNSMTKCTYVNVITIAGTSFYLGYYGYEYCTWNDSAKEKVMKRQLKRFLSSLLHGENERLTKCCQDQLNGELGNVLSGLKAITDESHLEIKEDNLKVQKEILRLGTTVDSLTNKKKNAAIMSAELDEFFNAYFKQPSSHR